MKNSINNDNQVVFISEDQNNENQSHDSKTINKPNAFISLLFEYFLIYFGTFSTQYLIISTFQLEFELINMAMILLLFCILPFLVFQKHGQLRVFIALILCCVFVLANLKKVIISGILCVNQMIAVINEPYSLNIETIPMPQFAQSVHARQEYVIVLASIFLALAVGYVVLIKHSILKAAIGTTAVLLFCLSFDVIPSAVSIMLVAAYLLSVLSMTARFNKNIRKSVTLFVLCLTLLLFGTLFLLVPEKNYKRVAAFEHARLFIQDIINPIQNTDHGGSEGVGGINGGKLGEYEAVKYTDQTLFQLKNISLLQDQYYKSYIGAVYKDNRWNDVPDSYDKNYEDIFKKLSRNHFYPDIQTGALLSFLKDDKEAASIAMGSDFHYNADILKYDFSIQYINHSKKYWILPYASTVTVPQKSSIDGYPINCGNGLIQGEAYHFLKSPDYSGFVDLVNRYQGSNEYLNEYIQNEKMYRNYVYNVYTSMPENTNFIKQFASGKRIEKSDDIDTYSDEVVKYLSTHFKYTLAPGKVPENRDFVDYFFNESKQGYCTYFATTATLMFRAAGIPARYVEGYKVTAGELQNNISDSAYLDRYDEMQKKSVKKKMDISLMDVKDRNAHAWVEIYRDGYGWQPVEVTPSTNESGNDRSDKKNNIASIKQTVQDVSEEETVQTETQRESVEDTTSEYTSVDDENSDTGNSIQSHSKVLSPKQVIVILITFIFLLLIIWRMVIFVRARLYIRRLLSYNHIRDYNAQVVMIFHYIERLAKALNLEKPPYMDDMAYYVELQKKTKYFAECDINGIINIVYKVRFGNYPAVKEDAIFVTKEAVELRSTIWKQLSIWERVTFILKKL